jgi:transposase
MSTGPRVIRPDRRQLYWDMVDLDSQLAEDHRARLVWGFVEQLELKEFYDRIKARDETAGRPTSDPAVLLAVWLYATLDGVGSARALARLCESHAAYRWLCGGVPINHTMLSEFRRDSGAFLDRLLTQSIASLIAEGLVRLEEVAIDGTKARARAGRGSMSKAKRLRAIERAVGERVAALKSELEQDPSGAERQRRERSLKAAEAQAARLKRAGEKLATLNKEQAERAKTHGADEAEKGEPKVSTSDPEARSMRLADGATAPAWNVQVATSDGFVVTIDPTDRRNDSGLATGLVEQITRRCGRAPERLLADTGAMTQDDIVGLAERYPDLTVYSPPPAEKENVTAETERKRRWKRRREPPPLKAWRERMASEEGKQTYRHRKLTERAHGQMKNRGMTRFMVHGRKAVHAVCLLHALALNLLWANTLRARLAATPPVDAGAVA